MKFDCCKTEKTNKELERTAEFLKVIAEPNRLRILCILQQEEMCVCDIWEYLDLPQNLTSHHLKVLKDFGLVESRKEGTRVIYSVDDAATDQWYALLSSYISTSEYAAPTPA